MHSNKLWKWFKTNHRGHHLVTLWHFKYVFSRLSFWRRGCAFNSIAFRSAWKGGSLNTSCRHFRRRESARNVGSGFINISQVQKSCLEWIPSGMGMLCSLSHSIIWALFFAAVGTFLLWPYDRQRCLTQLRSAPSDLVSAVQLTRFQTFFPFISAR